MLRAATPDKTERAKQALRSLAELPPGDVVAAVTQLVDESNYMLANPTARDASLNTVGPCAMNVALVVRGLAFADPIDMLRDNAVRRQEFAIAVAEGNLQALKAHAANGGGAAL